MLFSTFALHVRYALVILLLVILIILMSKWTGSKCSTVTVVKNAERTALELVTESQDMVVRAEQQPPVLALMHIAGAHAYLDVAERLAPNKLKPLQLATIRGKLETMQHSLMPLVVHAPHQS